MKASGLGGFFFWADDPDALSNYYKTHLFFNRVTNNDEDPVWSQQSGTTMSALFHDNNNFLGGNKKQWMLNLRVTGLDTMIALLTLPAIAVTLDSYTYLNDRLAQRIIL